MLKKVGKFVMKSNENGKKIESIENCNKFFSVTSGGKLFHCQKSFIDSKSRLKVI